MEQRAREQVIQGSRMKTIREREGLTQVEMAIKIGVSLSLIKQMETGHKAISINLAKTYATWFKSSLDYIYFGKEV